jgi:hypothetical protein
MQGTCHNNHELRIGKTVPKVTDNASSFFKALSEYMVVEDDPELIVEEVEEEHAETGEEGETHYVDSRASLKLLFRRLTRFWKMHTSQTHSASFHFILDVCVIV